MRLAAFRSLFRWLAHGLVPDIASNLRGAPLKGSLPPPPAVVNGGCGIAVVTGATGGLGVDVCRGLAAHGFELVIAGRDVQAGHSLVEEIAASGGNATFELCDLSTAGGAASLACSLLERGRIDLLVNNAGVMGRSVSAAETMTVNAIAPAVLTLGLMPQLALSPSPRVVNVASSAHLRVDRVDPAFVTSQARDATLSAYSASKLALLHFSTLLREALPGAPQLVVHDCHPGLVWTPLLKRTYGPRLAAWLERTSLRRILARDPARGAEAVLAACLLTDDVPQSASASEGRPAREEDDDEGGALLIPAAAAVQQQQSQRIEERDEAGTARGGRGGGTNSGGGKQRGGGTYFVDGAPKRRAQSAVSLNLEAARATWTDVLADAVQPATVAIDVTRKTRGIDARALRFSLYAFERGYRLDDDGRLEAVV